MSLQPQSAGLRERLPLYAVADQISGLPLADFSIAYHPNEVYMTGFAGHLHAGVIAVGLAALLSACSSSDANKPRAAGNADAEGTTKASAAADRAAEAADRAAAAAQRAEDAAAAAAEAAEKSSRIAQEGLRK